MRRVLLLFLAINATAAPPRVEPQQPVKLKEHREPDGLPYWTSRKFRIDSGIKLPQAELQRLAKLADTTDLALEAFPLPVHAPPEPEGMRLRVCGNDESYQKAGGLPDTAGMYLPKRNYVVLHAQHLFQSRPGSQLKAAANEDLIVHEICHLLMHDVAHLLPQWLNEGLCEYFACAHTGGGSFRFDQMDREIREHLRGRFNRVDPAISVRSVPELISSRHVTWFEYLGKLPVETRHHAYGTALLLTHYYLHGGPERRQQIAKLLEPRSHRAPDPLKQDQIDGTLIQKQLVTYWRPKGLTLEFPKSQIPR